MTSEPHICPVCWAFQDPDTGHCLVCGEKYYVLDMPTVQVEGDKPSGHFLMPFLNGFATFYAEASIDIQSNRCEEITGLDKPMPIPCKNEATITFNIIPDDDNGTLFKFYAGTLTN